MRTVGLLIPVALLVFGAGAAHAQLDAHCSARSVPPNAPMPEPFVIFFDSNSAAILKRAADVLDNAAGVLKTVPACPVIIQAHADRSGDAGYNMALSRRRAEAVRAYLRRHGVRSNIEILASGETHPLAESPDGAGASLNRRAEVTIGLNP